MVVRLLLGLVKGAVLGAAVGYGAFELGLDGGWGYLVYGAIGFVVGLLVGRPIWSHLFDKEGTIWTSVLKGLVGFGVGIGLYALGHSALGDPVLPLGTQTHRLTEWTYLFGGLVGALYGAWVEVDDAPARKPPADAAKPTRKSR
jgi:hypothetical protein